MLHALLVELGRGSVVVIMSEEFPTVEMGASVLVMVFELRWVGTSLMVAAGTCVASSVAVATMVRVEARSVDLV